MADQQTRLLIRNMHRVGFRVAEIAEDVGLHRATIHRILTSMGEELDTPRVRSETCVNGHSKADAIFNPSRGGYRCRECKRASDRAYQARRASV